MSSKSGPSGSVVAGRWLALFGALLLVGSLVGIVGDTSLAVQGARLAARGRSVAATIQSVEEIRNDRWVSYEVRYTFQPSGKRPQFDTVKVEHEELVGIVRREPLVFGMTDTRDRQPVTAPVRYLPEAPGVNRLEGVQTPFHYGAVVSLLLGMALLLGGLRKIRRPPFVVPPAGQPFPPGRPVPLGTLVYRPLSGRSEWKPSPGYLTIGLVFGILFAGHAGQMAVSLVRAWGMVILPLALPLGAVVVLASAMMYYLVTFWRHPTVFDYEAGVFRRAGVAVRPLRDLSEIRLRLITDPTFSGKAKAGVALAFRDGSVEGMEPRQLPTLMHWGRRPRDPFTDLGILEEGPPLEAVRRALEEVAAQSGVPVKETHEQGSLAPGKAMTGM